MEGNVLPIPAPAVAFATRPRPRPPAPLQPGHDAPYERRWNSAQTFSVSGAKPLLAASGRTVRGEPGPRTIAAKAGRDDEIAPDGAFGGREGRQFAVANVGNHGRIYLRPSVRRANQRYPPPPPVFPVTPPSTAGLGLEAVPARQSRGERESTLMTLENDISTPMLLYNEHPGVGSSNTRPGTRPRRAMSDSTVPDTTHTSIARESDPGGFKIVISHPGEEQRPRIGEGPTRSDRPPLLDINIPTWRLGTPRFSMRGTPIIRGSFCTPTEDVRSSSSSSGSGSGSGSSSSSSLLDLTPDTAQNPAPTVVQEPQRPRPDMDAPSIPRLSRLPRAISVSSRPAVDPSIFDALTFKPACDDGAIVRYSTASGAVTAATPPRLVAEITSPSVLDYELLSDFFLTYRTFLDSSDLLRMLIARLRWALGRDDEIGIVVRVRAFVALRHWILNYFMDDFVVDYALRLEFCALLNNFVDELLWDPRGRVPPLRLLAELKKCWRRVCSQYWDGPDYDASLGANVPIMPGGIAGHRDPTLDPSFWERKDAGPPQIDSSPLAFANHGPTSFYVDVSRAGHIDWTMTGLKRPGTPDAVDAAAWEERAAASPTSLASLDVTSCSFPAKMLRHLHPGTGFPLGAHPVDPSSMYANHDPIATTPRVRTSKRPRQPPKHKRNGSWTDSPREHAGPTAKAHFKHAEFLLAMPYAGSLVRGNLFPPGQPFVEVRAPGEKGAVSRETTLFRLAPVDASREKPAGSAMSGQGMRRLIGGVRRALSNKDQVVSPTQGNFINIPPLGPRGVTVNRLPGTAIVPQARPRQNGVHPPVRIDLLGAEVAEDFKKAVREDAAAEAERHGHLSPPAAGSRVPADMLDYSAAHMDTTLYGAKQADDRPDSQGAGISEGSKSILIVDATVHAVLSSMAGALPVVNPSVEDFAETYLANAADPTPPNTPPSQPLGTPRRSSFILTTHVLRPALSADPLPPLCSNLRSLSGQGDGTPLPERGHGSDRSSPPHHTNVSSGHRRPVARSNETHRVQVRSIDATTYSAASDDAASDSFVPQPLRMLRRRPGGDLRAATNVRQLHGPGPRRSRSVGSLTTYSESVESSYVCSPVRESSGYVDVVSSEYSPRLPEMFSLGAITERKPKRASVSIFSTNSSKPIMRPSFEAEAQKLARIPDDMDDDGGVESALLKLEGKYEKSRPISLDALAAQSRGKASANPARAGHRRVYRGEHLPGAGPPSALTAAVPWYGALTQPDPQDDSRSFLSDDSRASHSSIPLLERGLTEETRGKQLATRAWADLTILLGPGEGSTLMDGLSLQASVRELSKFGNRKGAAERVDKLEPIVSRPPSNNLSPVTDKTFLDMDSDGDDNDDGDLSSDFSAGPQSFHGHDRDDMPAHALGEKSPNAPHPARPSPDPPSPPLTLGNGAPLSPATDPAPVLQEHHTHEEKPLPPTPDTTPPMAAAAHGQFDTSPGPVLPRVDPTGTEDTDLDLAMADPTAPVKHTTRNRLSVHLPFVLAFDSDVLAQQFTLIEKDALNDIDWKELIEMRWKDSEGINSRSWVSFLRDTDARGVQVVIARFNLMVKWAISEAVLTQDIEERARCVIKFIHIAAHCRRYRNFATMGQLTIALTSNEITRLSKTWALVPTSDLQTLQELEALISPTRNFWNLRAEMEGAGKSGGAPSADLGCIPFVGIYTHDLLFNALRPSEVAGSPTSPPLINFERCRTAAAVVKTLLRLLEASTLYDFQPIEGITERCLWMAALSDEEIRSHSEGLE